MGLGKKNVKRVKGKFSFYFTDIQEEKEKKKKYVKIKKREKCTRNHRAIGYVQVPVHTPYTEDIIIRK